MSENEELDEDRVWEEGWEAHELAQLRRLARIPLVEKIRWLERAQRLAKQLNSGRNSPTKNRRDSQ